MVPLVTETSIKAARRSAELASRPADHSSGSSARRLFCQSAISQATQANGKATTPTSMIAGLQERRPVRQHATEHDSMRACTPADLHQ